MNQREIALKVAWHYLGTPYRWGGDDSIVGFDCSGFVIEILKSAGRLPRMGDWSSGQLHALFPIVPAPHEGCLVFYGAPTTGNIWHVEFCLDGIFSIGASGGGSTTVSDAVAATENAYIKVRPMASRLGIVGYVDPFIDGGIV